MVEPIKITKEMVDARQERIDKAVARQNAIIKSAMERKRSTCVFELDKSDELYSEVRTIFERAGYKIKPTGYIGGVWQLTEDMYWQKGE